MSESSVPTTIKEAAIRLSGVEHGYVKGFKMGVNATLVKEYSKDSSDPALLKQGNRSYPISIDSLFIDSTKANLVLAGVPLNIWLTPSGGLNYILGQIVLSAQEVSATDPGALMQKVSGEGDSLDIVPDYYTLPASITDGTYSVTLAHGMHVKPRTVKAVAEGDIGGQTIMCEWDETTCTASVASPPFLADFTVYFIIFP